MPIGTFAQRSGMTASALRFYAGSGLLTPAKVDPVSGYFRRMGLSTRRANRSTRHTRARPLWPSTPTVASSAMRSPNSPSPSLAATPAPRPSAPGPAS
ncbi:MerR family transcriptional regulator [Saccharopolyspora gloriosae]|uniref:MerR family transcriptional regulator n=1 Tax=Saccharopolyspora gloriosae TaxID=455344 RepID=UPI0021610869|nr:MerR family transcriptional regulator [Saccharopolyspora gloriosae]